MISPRLVVSRFATVLALLLVTSFGVAASASVFNLAPLPYPADALEPVIDAETMRIHHGRHHKAYVDNLNTAVAQNPALQGLSLDALVAEISRYPLAVRNNGGGHWNHTFFWESMTRPGTSKPLSPALRAAIERDFGSLEAMQSAFRAAGLARFGSGWAWLIVNDGKLSISSTANQDNPLMDVVNERGVPLLGNDVWEHAYYLKYQNRRGDYLDAWWQLVDWEVISTRFESAIARGAELPSRN
jgi:Fe-Mn family superoxide dismutase